MLSESLHNDSVDQVSLAQSECGVREFLVGEGGHQHVVLITRLRSGHVTVKGETSDYKKSAPHLHLMLVVYCVIYAHRTSWDTRLCKEVCHITKCDFRCRY